jgi:1-deoxy-D-xylulose-5-phosphate reductoisomerase
VVPKGVAVLGSTGSVGRRALEVIAELGDRFEVVGLTANRNVDCLLEQCGAFHPLAVAVGEKEGFADLRDRIGAADIEVCVGLEGIVQVASMKEADIVLNALVGSVGLVPTIEALRRGKRVALANKEALVMGGELVMRAGRDNGGEVIPVDSEHSAIFQVLNGRRRDLIDSIILTASGGPFRNYSAEQLETVTVEEALAHPVWKMGDKITVDSASLANKGLEVIEAHFLFGLDYDRIEVVIHPQSVVHSMVRFIDGPIMAQLGTPDMKLPIQYALTYPDRVLREGEHYDLVRGSPLTFEEVREDLFPVLAMAFHAGKMAGTAPAVFNAANEEAARGFLEERLPFQRIPGVIERVLMEHPYTSQPDWDVLMDADRWARRRAKELIC